MIIILGHFFPPVFLGGDFVWCTKNPGVLFQEKKYDSPKKRRINPSTPPHEEETKNMPKGQRSSEQSTKQSPIAPQQKGKPNLKGTGGGRFSILGKGIVFSLQELSITYCDVQFGSFVKLFQSDGSDHIGTQISPLKVDNWVTFLLVICLENDANDMKRSQLPPHLCIIHICLGRTNHSSRKN